MGHPACEAIGAPCDADRGVGYMPGAIGCINGGEQIGLLGGEVGVDVGELVDTDEKGVQLSGERCQQGRG